MVCGLMVGGFMVCGLIVGGRGVVWVRGSGHSYNGEEGDEGLKLVIMVSFNAVT